MSRLFSLLLSIVLLGFSINVPSALALGDFSGSFIPRSDEHCNPTLPRANRVFFDGDLIVSTTPDGSWSNPYSRMEHLEAILVQEDDSHDYDFEDDVPSFGDFESSLGSYHHENIRYVCFTGTFEQSVDLFNIPYTDLYFGSYGGGAELPHIEMNKIGYEYVAELDFLETFTVENLSIDGIYVGNLDSYTISDSEVGNQGFLTENTNEVTIKNNHSLSGIIVRDAAHAEINNVAVTGFPYYAVGVTDIGYLKFTNNHELDYDAAGLQMQSVNYADIHNNTFDASNEGGYNGIRLEKEVDIVGASGDNNENIYIYNNFFLDHESVAVYVLYTYNLELHNNSFHGNAYALMPTAEYNSFRNNIFDASDGYAVFDWPSFVLDPDSISSSFNIYANYNLYNGWVIEDVFSDFDAEAWALSFTEWASLFGETNSLEGDPLFISDADLHLQTGSPAIDAGTSQPSFFKRFSIDIDGEYRKFWDIGADELH